MKCQISVSAPNRKHPEPVVRGVQLVEKVIFLFWKNYLRLNLTFALGKSKKIKSWLFKKKMVNSNMLCIKGRIAPKWEHFGLHKNQRTNKIKW